MKKAAIIISLIVMFLAVGSSTLLLLNPSATAQIAFWVQPTQPETEPTQPPTETQPQAEQITLSGKNDLKKGDTAEIAVKYSPQNAAVPKISWTTSDEKVATVDSAGLVTAVGRGECEITAESENGIKAVVKIAVKDEELEKINALNNYLIKISDSRLEKYGTNSTMLLTLQSAEIDDFNGDKSDELLITFKSASGCEFAEIVALNSVDNAYEIKNFQSFADVFERNYDSYK